MKMRNMIAAVAAMAVSAVCAAAMPVSAAETAIAYAPTDASLGTGDDGISLRKNLYNVWGDNKVTDIAGDTTVNEYLTVTFNVSGIGSDSAGEDGVAYYVYLGGSIAGESYHQGEWNGGYIPQGQFVNVTGDGQYSVTWEVSSENIDCLYLQSNINIYAYGENSETGEKATCAIDVVSIVTDDGVTAEETTTAPSTTTAPTTTTAAGSTTAAGGTTKAGSTTVATTTAAATTNTATGDNSGIAVAVAALAVAGGVALVTKKNNK